MAGITDFVPQDISRQISDITERAMEDAPDFSPQPGEEVKKSPVGFEGQLGVGVEGPELSRAIDQRASRKYDADMALLRNETMSRALEMKFNRLNQAAQLVRAEDDQNNRARMNKYLEDMNRKRARAGVLGNILGIGGAVAGGMMGGPAGAMAGYQIGQGTGQALG